MRLMLWLMLMFMISSAAEARVFDYKDSTFGAYVRGTGAMSQLGQDAFGNEAGAGVTVDGTSKYNYGAELGMAFGFANTHVRLGAEIIQYSQVAGAGSNSGGTSYYDLTSSVFVFNPNVALEHVFSAGGSMRYYIALGAGYANVTAVNDYKMTAAGSAAFGGLGDFKETMDTNVLSATVSTGLETLFTDNVTLMADVGYRYLPVRQMKYKNDATNFTGTVHKGDAVLNSDGSKRTLNLGGLFVGVAFRFYLNFM